MKKILIIIILSSLIVACSKNDYQTKPEIKLNSINGDIFPVGSNFSAKLEFTDKEGDIGKGQFVYFPQRINKRPLPPGLEYIPVTIPIPDFPDNSKGEFELKLRYVDLHKSDIENDTIIMRFVAIDRAGNASETTRSNQIVILKN